MPHLYPTFEQLKAMKDLWTHKERVNWTAYDEFVRLVLTAPLDEDDEEHAAAAKRAGPVEYT